MLERQLHPYACALEFVKVEARRFNKAKAKVISHPDPLPPRVAQDLALVYARAAGIPTGKVALQGQDEALEPLLHDSSKTARVIFSEVAKDPAKAFDRGCMALTDLLCHRVVAACTAKGIGVASTMSPRHTTAGWAAQYKGAIFKWPSASDLEKHVDKRATQAPGFKLLLSALVAAIRKNASRALWNEAEKKNESAKKERVRNAFRRAIIKRFVK